MNKVALKISGMHCTSCALSIDLDLEDLPGVKSAKTHFAKSITEIEFDSTQIELQVIIAKISQLGYGVAA